MDVPDPEWDSDADGMGTTDEDDDGGEIDNNIQQEGGIKTGNTVYQWLNKLLRGWYISRALLLCCCCGVCVVSFGGNIQFRLGRTNSVGKGTVPIRKGEIENTPIQC